MMGGLSYSWWCSAANVLPPSSVLPAQPDTDADGRSCDGAVGDGERHPEEGAGGAEARAAAHQDRGQAASSSVFNSTYLRH